MIARYIALAMTVTAKCAPPRTAFNPNPLHRNRRKPFEPSNQGLSRRTDLATKVSPAPIYVGVFIIRPQNIRRFGRYSVTCG